MAGRAFSASMMLADLDYIAPSQACIKPLLVAQPRGGDDIAAAAGGGGGSVALHRPGVVLPPELVKISLQDCLACSGCVTTAETMLVTQQSCEELLRTVESRVPRLLVVSISDPAAASVAARLRVPVAEAFAVISGFCKHVLGRQCYAVDLQWAQQVAQWETGTELLSRLAHPEDESRPLPLIVSSCPGWVCYCEKTHPNLIPHLAPVMSPQAICGRFLEEHVAPAMGLASTDVMHISVQPCFDKKLEAVRAEFVRGSHQADGDDAAAAAPPPVVDAEGNPLRETDCVLSAQELLEWMEKVDNTFPWRSPLDALVASVDVNGAKRHLTRAPDSTNIVCPDGGNVLCGSPHEGEALALLGSGGYHQHAMARLAASTAGASSFRLADIEYAAQRNANHRVATHPALLAPSGAPMKFTVAYGFQHVQNIVRLMKRGGGGLTARGPMAGIVFIEMMACPEGCLNGGGQIRVAGTAAEQRAALQEVADVYRQFTREIWPSQPGDDEAGAMSSTTTTSIGGDRLSSSVAVVGSDGHLVKARRTGDSDVASSPAVAAATCGSAGSVSFSSLFTQESIVEWLTLAAGRSSAHETSSSMPLARVHTVFHDRKKEMEASDASAHSLRW